MQSITAFNTAIKIHRDQLAGDLTRQIICAEELAERALMKSRKIVFLKLDSREEREICDVESGYHPKRVNRTICTVRFESSFIENHIVAFMTSGKCTFTDLILSRLKS